MGAIGLDGIQFPRVTECLFRRREWQLSCWDDWYV